MAQQPIKLALMPGDGIGVEVVAAAERVLDTLRQRYDLPLSWDTLPWPSTAWHREHGEMMPVIRRCVSGAVADFPQRPGSLGL